MDLICPSCEARFVVDAKKLGPAGRTVRCGDCGNTWHQDPLAEAPPPPPAPKAPSEPEPPAEPEVAPKPDEGLPERPRRRPDVRRPPAPKVRRASPQAAGWALFLIVLVGLGALFYFGRQQIVAMAPQAERLYALFGIATESPEQGLELRDVKSVRRLVDGERVVVIEGVVANVSDKTKELPSLEARLTDGSGAELDRWTFSAAESTLDPGTVTAFETTAKNPPREGNVAIDFVVRN